MNEVKRIRRRNSYLMFREFAGYLMDRPSIDGTLRYVHSLLDEKRAYRSRTVSQYAKESLELLISELGGSQ